jgi:hypothetical protein
MTWRLSTQEKKSITEVQTWSNGELTATYEIGWRWGHWDFDTKPDISIHDPEGQTEVYSFGDVQDQEQDDGCWASWTWPEGMDEAESERLEEIFNDEGLEGLENEGWTNDENEYFVSGPLSVEYVIQNYTKKPLVIQAVPFTPDTVETLREFCGAALGAVTETEAHIRTLEDGSAAQVEHIATLGDYIIRGIRGEFYPCKPDIFEATYETTWRKYEILDA